METVGTVDTVDTVCIQNTVGYIKIQKQIMQRKPIAAVFNGHEKAVEDKLRTIISIEFLVNYKSILARLG